MKKWKGRMHSGFTFVELLLVVAIIAILGLIGVVSVTETRRSMQQLELDRIAENLYSAAQNQLALRAAYGDSANEELTAKAALVQTVPADMSEDDKRYFANRLYYVSPAQHNGSMDIIFPEGSIGEDLRSGTWIVEIAPESSSVYSVFYAAKESYLDLNAIYAGGENQSVTLSMLRGTSGERKSAAHGTIGYYSGSVARLSGKKAGELACRIKVENKEELKVSVSVAPPSESPWEFMDFIDNTQKASVLLQVRGAVSGAVKTFELGEVTLSYGQPSETIGCVLDSLKSGKSFSDQFSGDGLIPGEDLILSAVASYTGDKFLLYPGTDSARANSLFADGSGADPSSVYVAAGRHLQNLNAASSHYAPSALAAPAVKVWQTEDIAFGETSSWADTYAKNFPFTPIKNAVITEYHGNGKGISGLRVSTDGDAGIFAAFDGNTVDGMLITNAEISGTGSVGAIAGRVTKDITFTGVTLVDCVVLGADAAGGLAGSVAGNATIGNCQLYMDQRKSEANARNVHWIDASSGTAGGLVGSAAGTVSIDKSLAATVVRAQAYAGGLVGSAGGSLTVKQSYANCYLNAQTIGGLAGACSGGSFDTCYSAGFAMYGSSIYTAAGFVPSTASVSNCYTIFCFDDATEAETVSGQVVPKPAPDSMARYALTKSGTATNAYYTYDGAQSVGSAQLKSAEELEALSISGFRTGAGSAAPYNLTDNSIKPSAEYPYPKLTGLAMYNDFLIVDSNPVELYRFIINGWADDPYITDESKAPGYPFAVTRMSGDRVVVPTSVSRLLHKEVFVGWFSEDQLPQLAALTGDHGWCAQLDDLDINGERFDGVPGPLGALTERVEDQTHYVVANDKIKADRKLFAVYREVKAFDVLVKFMSFNPDAWLGAGNNNITPEKYMGGGTFAIGADFVYTVDPIIYAINNANYKTETRTFDLTKGLSNGYTIVDQYYDLDAAYPGKDLAKGIPPVACFDKDLRVIEGETPYSAASASAPKYLTIKLDQKRTYAVLCNAAMIDVPVQFVFRNSQTAGAKVEFTINEYSTLKERFAAVEKALESVEYSPDAGDTYTATVWMRFPPNVIVWSELPEFEGFKLLRDEIENMTITDASESKENAPIIPYERTLYTLAFDLDSGFCEVTENGVTDRHDALESIGNMHYMEQVKPKLPEPSKLSRPKWRFAGWKFYTLETYDPKNAPVLGEIKVKDENGALSYDGGFMMPHGNVMAQAQWVYDDNAPVRVEIYVQNVTDPLGAAADKKTYSFYNAYTVAPRKNEKRLTSFYEKATNVDALLRTAYADMLNNGNASVVAAVDLTKYPNSPAVQITDDTREYLRDAHVEQGGVQIDGSVKNHQLVFNETKTGVKTDGKFPYSFDATGAAVFQIYYDRAEITFTFKLDRVEKQVNEVGYGDIYKMYKVNWDPDDNRYEYNNYPAYVLTNDDDIDRYVGDLPFARTTDRSIARTDYWSNNYYYKGTNFDQYFSPVTADSPLIEHGGRTYIFGRCLDVYNSDGSSVNSPYCFIPYYDSSDLAAQPCRWLFGDEGVYNQKKSVGLYRFEEQKGLYEAPLAKWPEGNYGWFAYNAGTNEDYAHNGNSTTTLSYLASFYYDSWIEAKGANNKKLTEAGTKAHALHFDAQPASGSIPVRFYLEKGGSGLDASLRTYMNTADADHTKSGIDAAVNGWVAASGTALFNDGENYAHVWNGTGGNFSLNDKFTGYTVKGYRVDEGDFVPVLSLPKSTGQQSSSLDIYNLRNWSYVFFENISNQPTEAYFYKATLDRLPDVKSDLANYRPANVGDGYAFFGWYTASNGGGDKLIVGKDENGKVTEVTKGSGGWIGGDGCKVYRCVPNGEVNGYDYVPLTMPESNLRIFAYWDTTQVSVDFYSRLPVAPGVTPETEKPYHCTDVHLSKPIPQTVFDTVEGQLGLVTEKDPRDESKTIRVYKVPDTQLEYAFDGWYRTNNNGVPGHDDVLLYRFHEQEFITRPGTTNLAAQWTQVKGQTYYDITCVLLKEDGTEDSRFTIYGSEANGQKAWVNEPLNVNEPSKVDHPELGAYYSTSPLVSVDKFQPGMEIVFFYRPAESWTYTVRNMGTYKDVGTGAERVVLLSKTRSTAALNAIVYPEELMGYILDPNAKQKQIMKTDAEEDKVAEFDYTLDYGSIRQPAALDWPADGIHAPEFVEIENFNGGVLACAQEGLEIRTYYSVDGGEKSLEVPRPARGVYTVTVTIELWQTTGTAPELTIYCGTTTLRVYSTVSIGGYDGFVLYTQDGEHFYVLDAETKTLRLVKAEDFSVVFQKLQTGNAGKTFRGLYLDDAQIIDADGKVTGKISSSANNVALTPKFEEP